jgi:peptidylprolyl isomerase
MRHIAAAFAAALALSACVQVDRHADGASSWRPNPVAGAREPSEVLAATTAGDWRPVDPENLLLMELADGSRVAIELAADFAPVHVANIRAFARGGWWNGRDHLPGAGQLRLAMGKRRCRKPAAPRRRAHASGRI